MICSRFARSHSCAVCDGAQQPQHDHLAQEDPLDGGERFDSLRQRFESIDAPLKERKVGVGAAAAGYRGAGDHDDSPGERAAQNQARHAGDITRFMAEPYARSKTVGRVLA